MAAFNVRRDAEYGYLSSGDQWSIDEDVFATLGDTPYMGRWSTSRSEFRFDLTRFTLVLQMLQARGHRIIDKTGDQRPVLLECSECASPRKGALEGDPCVCGGVMVRPHVCTESCRANAWRPGHVEHGDAA